MELIAVPDTFGTRYNRLVCPVNLVTLELTVRSSVFFPLYGHDCQSTCNCTKDECDPIHGCRNLSGKTVMNICNGINGSYCCNGNMWNKEKTKCIPCEIGYHGVDCATECSFPSYGHECQFICACEETDCDFVNG